MNGMKINPSNHAMMQKIIKISLAGLLLICLAKMPYGYYQFIRLAATIAFIILAYLEYQEKRVTAVIIYAGLAILFQPLIKIALGRQLWNIVDVIVAVGLILSLFVKLPGAEKS